MARTHVKLDDSALKCISIGTTGNPHAHQQKYGNSTIAHVHRIEIFTTIYLILDYNNQTMEKMSSSLLYFNCVKDIIIVLSCFIGKPHFSIVHLTFKGFFFFNILSEKYKDLITKDRF